MLKRLFDWVRQSFKRSWPRAPFWVWFALALLYAVVAQLRQE